MVRFTKPENFCESIKAVFDATNFHLPLAHQNLIIFPTKNIINNEMNFIKLLKRQLPPLNEKTTTNNVIKFNQALLLIPL